MEEIIPHLYLGNDQDVSEAKYKNYSICAMCKSGPNSYKSLTGHEGHAAPKGPDYYWFQKGNQGAANLIDPQDPNFIHEHSIYPALDFIKDQMDEGKDILVHCNQGHSRGPTTVLMFLRAIGEMPQNFVMSERKFRTLYPLYDPSPGIESFARSHWAFLENKIN